MYRTSGIGLYQLLDCVEYFVDFFFDRFRIKGFGHLIIDACAHGRDDILLHIARSYHENGQTFKLRICSHYFDQL